MKVTIEFDTENPVHSAQIKVDDKPLGRVQKLALKLDLNGASEFTMTRRLGTCVASLRDVTSTLADDGVRWTLQDVAVEKVDSK